MRGPQNVSADDDTRWVITLGFGIMLMLMVTLVFISLHALRDVTNSTAGLVQGTHVRTQAAYQMRNAINLRAGTLKAMLLSDDPFERDDLALRMSVYAGLYREARERLVTQGMTDKEAELLTALSAQTRRSQPINERAVDLIVSDAPTSSVRSVLVRAAAEQGQLLSLLQSLVDLENQYAANVLDAAQDRYQKTRHVLTALAGGVLVLGLLIMLLVLRRHRALSQRIYYQARHDPLTGLFNRHELEQRLMSALADPTDRPGALLFLDLDRFKLVNDSCGHIAGDALLASLARTLAANFDDRDVLARQGGDEFAALVRGRTADQCLRLARALVDAVENFRFEWNQQQFSLGVSVGLVALEGKGESLQDVLAAADMACYMAKSEGGNRVRAVSLDDRNVAELRSQANCVAQIRGAIEHDRFVLYGQRIDALRDDAGTRPAVELLLRLPSDDGELVGAAKVIPAAERYGLIVGIDRWVVGRAIALAARYARQDTPVMLMVNLSGYSLSDAAFLEFVQQRLAAAALPAGAICFEITETAAVADLGVAKHFVETLQPLGCRFALDDFGTGFSSFSYLQTLPVDMLKIDGSFVQNVLASDVSHAVVRSINEIGHALGMQTVAEYVESPTLRDAVCEMGVDYAQGYGIAYPAPLEEVLAESLKRQASA